MAIKIKQIKVVAHPGCLVSVEDSGKVVDTGDNCATVLQWTSKADQQPALVGADFQAFHIEPARVFYIANLGCRGQNGKFRGQ